MAEAGALAPVHGDLEYQLAGEGCGARPRCAGVEMGAAAVQDPGRAAAEGVCERDVESSGRGVMIVRERDWYRPRRIFRFGYDPVVRHGARRVVDPVVDRYEQLRSSFKLKRQHVIVLSAGPGWGQLSMRPEQKAKRLTRLDVEEDLATLPSRSSLELGVEADRERSLPPGKPVPPFSAAAAKDADRATASSKAVMIAPVMIFKNAGPSRTAAGSMVLDVYSVRDALCRIAKRASVAESRTMTVASRLTAWLQICQVNNQEGGVQTNDAAATFKFSSRYARG